MKRQTNRLILLSAIFLSGLYILSSCTEENNNGPTIFYSDIVSCHLNDDKSVYFEQILRDDQGCIILRPDEPVINEEIQEDQRILLQYLVNSTPSDSLYKITATYLSAIRYDTIAHATADSIATYPNDLVRMNALWRTGGYINLDISLEYYYRTHKLDLFYSPQQTASDTLDVILRHDSNDDIQGYWTQTYASFYIPEALNPDYKAIRIHANMPNDPIGYTVIKLRD